MKLIPSNSCMDGEEDRQHSYLKTLIDQGILLPWGILLSKLCVTASMNPMTAGTVSSSVL